MKSRLRCQNVAFKLLRLYPRAWRERYTQEAMAVLEERPATPRTLFDLVLGMLDAYLHSELFTERNFVMTQRLRNNQLNIFSAFVFCVPFIMLFLLFGPRSLPSWDVTTPPSHDGVFVLPYLALVFYTIIAVTLCAIVASLLGGGAFIVSTFLRALGRKKTRSFQPFLWSLLSFLFFAFFSLLISVASFLRGPVLPLVPRLIPFAPLIFFFLQLVSNFMRLRQGIREDNLSFRFMQPTLVPGLLGLVAFSMVYLVISNTLFTLTTLDTYIFLKPGQMFVARLALAGLLFAGTIIGGLIYIRSVLHRVTFTPDFLRLTMLPAVLTTFSMCVTLLLVLYHTWSIDTAVNARGWTLLSVPLLHITLLGVCIPTIIACLSLWRALSARRVLALTH